MIKEWLGVLGVRRHLDEILTESRRRSYEMNMFEPGLGNTAGWKRLAFCRP